RGCRNPPGVLAVNLGRDELVRRLVRQYWFAYVNAADPDHDRIMEFSPRGTRNTYQTIQLAVAPLSRAQSPPCRSGRTCDLLRDEGHDWLRATVCGPAKHRVARGLD